MNLSSVFNSWFSHLMCVVFLFGTSGNAVTVATRNGLVEGTVRISRGGKPFIAFLGIPYAKPPVGDLRFEPPQPTPRWTGVRSTVAHKDWCMQELGGSEDCLYLNVFTALAGTNGIQDPFPVMVFIHGGYYNSGSSHLYKPEYLMDENIVFVTIDYRLHSLGFLNTGDGLVGGNMGLKDQVMALKWIQENIINFGGDPNSVTIFGQSAGAASVSYLLLSPLTKGLFHRGISQSGSAFKIWSFQPKPIEQAKLLATRLGCPTGSGEAMVECLKKVSARKLTQMSVLSAGPLKVDLEVFLPTVEVNSQDAFISKHPYDILRAGEAHRIPWIAGVNSGEGLLYINPIKVDPCLIDLINKNWTAMAPRLLYYDEARTDVTARITEFYFGNQKIDFLAQFDKFTQLWSDRYYISFTRNAGEIQSRFSPVYFYYNDYLMNTHTEKVADHGEELFLIFPRQPLVELASKHFEMSRKMIKLWVQFASGESTLTFEGKEWKPVNNTSPGNVTYLKFSNAFNGVVADPIKERIELWNQINLYRVEAVNAGSGLRC